MFNPRCLISCCNSSTDRYTVSLKESTRYCIGKSFDNAEAERLYRILMKSDPPDASAPFNLGNMLRAEGRNVEAEAALRTATRVDPTFADAWYNLGDLLASRDALNPPLNACAQCCGLRRLPASPRSRPDHRRSNEGLLGSARDW
jgi:tetratricopeptide (TPR) repeat protein